MNRVYVIIGIRLNPDDEDRMRNVMVCLRALREQTARRDSFEILVVEQDTESRAQAALEPLCDHYILDVYTDAYNRSRAFNAGVKYVQESNPDMMNILCFLDSDLLIGKDWIERAVNIFHRKKTAALIPYNLVKYIDEASSERIAKLGVENLDFQSLTAIKNLTSSVGGSMWVRLAHYRIAGGYDERYIGWGCEDQDFFIRLKQVTKVCRMAYTIYHLNHDRPTVVNDHMKRNLELYKNTWWSKGILSPLGLEVIE